jgi:hypothetical protein
MPHTVPLKNFQLNNSMMQLPELGNHGISREGLEKKAMYIIL